MTRVRRSAFVVATLVAASAGCAAMLGIDDVTYRAASDAGVEGATISDASPDVDGGPPVAFCKTQVPSPRFCDDFDDDIPLKDKWKILRAEGAGAILGVSDAEARSPPNALVTAVVQRDAAEPDGAPVYLSTFVEAQFESARVATFAFDL